MPFSGVSRTYAIFFSACNLLCGFLLLLSSCLSRGNCKFRISCTSDSSRCSVNTCSACAVQNCEACATIHYYNFFFLEFINGNRNLSNKRTPASSAPGLLNLAVGMGFTSKVREILDEHPTTVRNFYRIRFYNKIHWNKDNVSYLRTSCQMNFHLTDHVSTTHFVLRVTEIRISICRRRKKVSSKSSTLMEFNLGLGIFVIHATCMNRVHNEL